MARIYLAGPMTGYSAYNAEAFTKARTWLRQDGFSVFCPSERDRLAGDPGGLDSAHYMAIDLPEVCQSDAVFLMRGWEASKCAVLEAIVATTCCIGVWELLYDEKDRPNGYRLLMSHPILDAHRIVQEVMREGGKKHAKDTWRTEPLSNHLLKCARHCITADLIHQELSSPDGEDHRKNALCRAAMACCR